MNINRQQYLQVILRHSKYYEVHGVSISVSIISVFDNTDSINPSLIEINSLIIVPEITSPCVKCASFFESRKEFTLSANSICLTKPRSLSIHVTFYPY